MELLSLSVLASISCILLIIIIIIVAPSEAFGNSIHQPHHYHNRDSSSLYASSHDQHQQQSQQPPILVVGKIIVDEYGDPSKHEEPSTVTVGGGAPQAAMGAALALAARDYYFRKGNDDGSNNDKPAAPPAQPVTLLAAVGDLDFSTAEEASLKDDILQGALQTPPILIRGPHLKTPRIRLWHNDEQVQQWYALNDSFGPDGAAGLWGAYPSVRDYEQALGSLSDKNTNKYNAEKMDPMLHVIIEGGASAPGLNGDTNPLLSPAIRKNISFLGVEPVAFPNEEQGIISEQDARHCSNLLQEILTASYYDGNNEDENQQKDTVVVAVSPDMPLHLAMLKSNCLPKSTWNGNSWAVRDGPRGSIIVDYLYNPEESLGGNDPLVCPTNERTIPAVPLKEEQLVNPTGAGNAYAAAFTALRGSGMDPVSSACIANSVGAMFCEYNHCPPYTWDVIERIAQASRQLQDHVTTTERRILQRYSEEQKRMKEQI